MSITILSIRQGHFLKKCIRLRVRSTCGKLYTLTRFVVWYYHYPLGSDSRWPSSVLVTLVMITSRPVLEYTDETFVMSAEMSTEFMTSDRYLGLTVCSRSSHGQSVVPVQSSVLKSKTTSGRLSRLHGYNSSLPSNSYSVRTGDQSAYHRVCAIADTPREEPTY